MPHLPHRFYASLRPLRLECPKCRRIISFGERSSTHWRAYDPLTGILTCPSCERGWLLGLAVQEAPNLGPGKFLPPDQIPTPDQLRTIRQLELPKGLYWPGRRRRGEPANRYQEEGCTCWPEKWRPGCPVHDGSVAGSRATTAEEDPEEEP